MTTLTLTIGGVDFLPQYKSGSVQITNQIQNQGDSCKLTILQKKGQNPPLAGAELILADGARTLFGGFISKLAPMEYGIGEMIEWLVEVTDYTYLLVNKTAQKNYTSATLASIVADLISQNVDASYGLSTAGVSTGPVITTIAFNHISIRHAFENLAKVTGFIWWIGYDKVIHFIDPNAASSAPEAITDSSGNHQSVSITVDATQLRNDVVVVGGVQESSGYTQIILADGQAREWFLLYPVKTMTSVSVDTGSGYVVKTVGVDPADDETLFNYMYSPDRGSLRASSGTTTPASTVKIKVIFTYAFPVVVELSNSTSIIAMKAIEGGDGVHKYTINDSTILSQDQARQKAQHELNQFSDPVLSGTVVTRTGLLGAGHYFSAGTALLVNLPSWGINSNTTYIIQKVVTTFTENSGTIEYTYTITFGGRLLGVVDFLQALATPEDPLDESGEVTVIHAIDENLSIAETIVKNAHLHSIAETVTIAETLTKVNVTPPFHYAPDATSNKGRYNEAEWG